MHRWPCGGGCVDDVIEGVREQLAPEHPVALGLGRDVPVHLAVIAEPWIGFTLIGERTVESRFLTRRSLPYQSVAAGDLLLIKRPGGGVEGGAVVVRAEHVALRRPADLDRVRAAFGAALRADLIADFWARHANARFASLIGIGSVVRLASPLHVAKSDSRSWTVVRRPPVQLALEARDANR